MNIASLLEPEYLLQLDPRKKIVEMPKRKMDMANSLYAIWFLWKKEVQQIKGMPTLTLYSRFLSDRESLEPSKQFERMMQCMYKSRHEFEMCRIYNNNRKGNKSANLPNNPIVVEMLGQLDMNDEKVKFSPEQLYLFQNFYIVPLMKELRMLT